MESSARILIVGAGVVGCSTAYHLARAGITDVLVVDQGPLFGTGGSSSHAPGLVFQTNASQLLTQLATYTVERFSAAELDGRPCFHQVGGIEVATTRQRWDDLRRKRGLAASWSGPAELIAAVRAAKQFLTFVGGAPFQPAVAHALRNELEWVAELRDGLQRKRDRLANGLAEAGLDVLASEGTYFICADVRPLGFTDGAELCRALPEKVGVAAIPVQVFCDNPEDTRHLVRFAFCKRDEVLDEGIRRLHKLAG